MSCRRSQIRLKKTTTSRNWAKISGGSCTLREGLELKNWELRSASLFVSPLATYSSSLLFFVSMLPLLPAFYHPMFFLFFVFVLLLPVIYLPFFFSYLSISPRIFLCLLHASCFSSFPRIKIVTTCQLCKISTRNLNLTKKLWGVSNRWRKWLIHLFHAQISRILKKNCRFIFSRRIELFVSFFSNLRMELLSSVWEMTFQSDSS